MADWISIKDRPPKIGKNVLVCFQNGDMAVACLLDTDEDLTLWRAMTDEGWTCDCDAEPTHWMHLPRQPGFAGLRKGDKVVLPGEKRPYTVRCRDDRFIICTKPMNLRHTVLYFIVDLKLKLRGPDNMIFCSGYETDDQCEARLKELQEGLIEVSRRRSVPLDQ